MVNDTYMIKRIHVNQHIIKRNRKTKKKDNVLTVKTYKSNDYGVEVEGNGAFRVVYRPEKPLQCGAVCWIETDSEIHIIQTDGKVVTR